MRKLFPFLVIVLLLSVTGWIANKTHSDQSTPTGERYRIMFYNVENLFDTEDDPLTRDEEFTPGGARRWTKKRFYQKINQLSKVILAVGEWDPPVVVGMCEIENRFVLEQLIYSTPLKKFNYRIIHYDSPDQRGIDVAMIYRDQLFEPLYSEPIHINFADDSNRKTRDILYVKGLIGGLETIHLFVNHWPSRRGGYMESKAGRLMAATILRQKVDSLFFINPDARILIMGDFNDNPDDESLTIVLGATKPSNPPDPSTLYNLMKVKRPGWQEGTLKFSEFWETFDQIILSGALLNETSPLFVDPAREVIFAADFLFKPDEKVPGKKLFRTYDGFRYTGGFSDHLPVYTDIFLHR